MRKPNTAACCVSQALLLLRSLSTLRAAGASGGLLLAMEGIDGTIGAGNALMVATRNSSTLLEWYGKYRSFSDGIWNGFSVRLPMDLAVQRPGSIALVNYTAFYDNNRWA